MEKEWIREILTKIIAAYEACRNFPLSSPEILINALSGRVSVRSFSVR